MAELPKIKTPWKQQWRRVRYQLLPVGLVAICIMGTGYLWRRHHGLMNGFGEVSVLQGEAVCRRDGMLVILPREQLRMFSEVKAGQTVLAQLDDRPATAALGVLKNDITRLRLELPGKEELIKAEQEMRKETGGEEARRLAMRVETLRLAVLDNRAQLASDRIELQRQNAVLDALNEAEASPAVSKAEYLSIQQRRDLLLERIRGNEGALVESEAQLEAACAQLKNRLNLALSNVQKVLSPVQGEISSIEMRLRDLEFQIDSLQIIAPISGRVVAIHRHPGQAIRAGEPVATISDTAGTQIVTYVRQDQRLRPITGMVVDVRARMPGVSSFASRIEEVGPRLEPVPAHQLRDSKRQEWGVPVVISLPAGLDVKPGELVDLRFRTLSAD